MGLLRSHQAYNVNMAYQQLWCHDVTSTSKHHFGVVWRCVSAEIMLDKLKERFLTFLLSIMYAL